MENLQKAYRIFFQSPIGTIGIGFKEKAVLCLSIGKNAEEEIDETLERIGFTIDPVSHPTGDVLKRELGEYFDGSRKKFTVKPEFYGTPFQTAVWKALYRLPYGKTLSYGDLAALADRPLAARAVGSAMGKNRIPIIVPCHRVITSDGKLGGFGCGLDVKRALLKIEGVLLS